MVHLASIEGRPKEVVVPRDGEPAGRPWGQSPGCCSDRHRHVIDDSIK